MKSQQKRRAIRLGNASMLTKTVFVGMLPEIENPILFYNM